MRGRNWIGIVVVSFAFLAGGFFFFLGSVISLAAGKPQKGDVAIVEITGVIYESRPVMEQLTALKAEGDVKAVVLRIDSPGGSVGASQEIFEAVKDLRETKPVVASLGTVAASGGYYIAAPANRIVANAGTITGSIGVRMELVNVEELLHWARVMPLTLKSGEFKDAGSPTRPVTAVEKEYLEGILKGLHGQFKKAIVESRGLTEAEVEKISDGKVFTGLEAKDGRLVDDIGNLNKAVKIAGELGGVKGEPKSFYPPQKDGFFWESLVEGVANRFSERLIGLLTEPARFTF